VKRDKDKAERRQNDHYVTPDWAIRRFLEFYTPSSPPPGRILDPCAAQGELLATTKEFFPDALYAACEINPAFADALNEATAGAVVTGDFLQSLDVLKRCNFDLIITNPPYALAGKFIKAALEVAPVVAMLLRINFLASQKRRDFLASIRPAVYVLPNRPSFTGGGTDSTEYAWMVFGDPHVAGRINWLELTPAEEIRAANERAQEIHGDEALLCRNCGTRGTTATCADCGGMAGLFNGTTPMEAP
jgi:predicted RNA methylase